MAAPAHSDLVAESLLRYLRNPATRAGVLAQRDTASFGIVARLALGKPVAFANAGLSSPLVMKTLRRAALTFIRRAQFRDDADHYELLGVGPDASMQSIRENHRLLIQIVHPDRASRELDWPEGIAARVNRAYFVLKHADSRAAYDRQRCAEVIGRGPPQWARAQAAQPSAVVRRQRPPPLPPMLPEWMTDRVGGFVRRNPTFTIFALLVSACSLAIASVIWLDPAVTLKRGDAPARALSVPANVAAPAAPTTLPAPFPLNTGGAAPASATPGTLAPVDPQPAAVETQRPAGPLAPALRPRSGAGAP